jgi:hypothetical protein
VIVLPGDQAVHQEGRGVWGVPGEHVRGTAHRPLLCGIGTAQRGDVDVAVFLGVGAVLELQLVAGGGLPGDEVVVQLAAGGEQRPPCPPC